MASVAFVTLGCKVNIYESNALMNKFKDAGYDIVDSKEVADAYVINTCTVTNQADAKSRKMIRQCQRLNPNAVICALGCYVQSNPGAKELPGIHVLIGNKDKDLAVEKVTEALNGADKFVHIINMRQNKEYDKLEATEFDHTRAFVKIEDGCNNFCTYCIIPFARGPIRSKRAKDVIEELKAISKLGYKEIVLSGIETGSYESNGIRLSGLIELILQEVPSIERIRISSIEMTMVDDKLLELMKNSKVIADHMHLPLQSGSDAVLKAMNRKYTAQEFLNRINDIKAVRPNISLTTDVIAGFPGETDVDHENTKKLIKDVGFAELHVFPYSKRAGTAAAKMKQTNDTIKKNRALDLIALSDSLSLEYRKKFVGSIQEVIVERKVDDKYMDGHSSNYLQIFMPLDEKYIKKMVRVKVVKADESGIFGEIEE